MLGLEEFVDDARVAPAVLGAVGPVDLVDDRVIGVLDGNLALDAGGGDVGAVAGPGDAVPGAAGSVGGADVDVVADTDGPDRRRAAQLAVAAHRRDVQLVGAFDAAQLVFGPAVHHR